MGLADERNLVNPVGLYDRDRRPHRIAAAYRQIIREFGNHPFTTNLSSTGGSPRTGEVPTRHTDGNVFPSQRGRLGIPWVTPILLRLGD